MRPEWLISGLSDEEEKTDTNTETNRPTELVSTLLAYWASPTFVRRHASLTLVQLQQLQPGVDLDVLLEQPEGLGRRSLISAESNPRDAGWNQGVCRFNRSDALGRTSSSS